VDTLVRLHHAPGGLNTADVQNLDPRENLGRRLHLAADIGQSLKVLELGADRLRLPGPSF
jgi:hypothetical protein